MTLGGDNSGVGGGSAIAIASVGFVIGRHDRFDLTLHR